MSRLRTTSFVDEVAKEAAAAKNPAAATAAATGGALTANGGSDGVAASGGLMITEAADGTKTTSVVATRGEPPHERQEISYRDTKIIGSGSFGVVFKVNLMGDEAGQTVAIKKVKQDKRFKNRELQTVKALRHENIVMLRYYFYSHDKDDMVLNLVLEFVPETLHQVARRHIKAKTHVPILHCKLYTFQLLRALGFIHGSGVCHRDIKPQNLLVDRSRGVLKVCDFGSAKKLVAGEPNVSYICSRFYRAPELIFGNTQYTTAIDMWSAGCVLGEMLLGQHMFPGESGVDQLVEIIKVLGTPTRVEIGAMNPNYTDFKFPQIQAHPWVKVFRAETPPEAMDLVAALLQYTPPKRATAYEALGHVFMAQLRSPECKLDEGVSLPQLFNFTEQELEFGGENLQAVAAAVATVKQQE